VTPSTKQLDADERLPTVIAVAPRCPNPDCGSTKHSSYRSIENGDGSRTKWTVCKACGQRFIIVLE